MLGLANTMTMSRVSLTLSGPERLNVCHSLHHWPLLPDASTHIGKWMLFLSDAVILNIAMEISVCTNKYRIYVYWLIIRQG